VLWHSEHIEEIGDNLDTSKDFVSYKAFSWHVLALLKLWRSNGTE
jgi:hypothetical protein